MVGEYLRKLQWEQLASDLVRTGLETAEIGPGSKQAAWRDTRPCCNGQVRSHFFYLSAAWIGGRNDPWPSWANPD